MQNLYISHLLACAVHGVRPMDKPEQLSWEGLFASCQRHSVTATVFSALAQLDIPAALYATWQEEYQKSVVKQLSFDVARGEILDTLRGAGIRHLPLKGVILKDYYPKIGMRMFCDNDILVESDRAEEVQKLMRGLGYRGQINPVSNQDVYKKPPILNIEIHKSMLQKSADQYDYWSDVWQRAEPVSDCLYQLTQEDFYLFFLNHFYKHFSVGGCGIRSLIDTYQLLCHCENQMDRSYLATELNKLGLTVFAAQMEDLAQTLFANPKEIPQLNPQQSQLLDEIMAAGTYGVHGKTVNAMFEKSKRSKLGYLLSRILPTYRYACSLIPVLAKYPLLYVIGFIPLCLFRFYRGISRLKHTKIEIDTVLKHK